MPYLKIADNEHLSRDDMGQRLTYPDTHIICENASYVVRSNTDDSIVRTIAVPQNKDGIDTEDRVQILKAYLSSL